MDVDLSEVGTCQEPHSISPNNQDDTRKCALCGPWPFSIPMVFTRGTTTSSSWPCIFMWQSSIDVSSYIGATQHPHSHAYSCDILPSTYRVTLEQQKCSFGCFLYHDSNQNVSNSGGWRVEGGIAIHTWIKSCVDCTACRRRSVPLGRSVEVDPLDWNGTYKLTIGQESRGCGNSWQEDLTWSIE